nr:EOG090X0FII [Macrothrix elegans]
MADSIDGDQFVFVKKKKSAKPRRLCDKKETVLLSTADPEACLKSITHAKFDLKESQFFNNFLEIFKNIISEKDCELSEIVCLGIGSISSCKTAQYQLALLLLLVEHFNCPAEVFDPIFSDTEKLILQNLLLQISKENSEGKVSVRSSGLTFFFLPHCPKELSNNLLYSNWNCSSLERCIIYGNSLEKLMLSTPSRFLRDYCYLISCQKVSEELPVSNSFRYLDIFNDLSLIHFPVRLLKDVPEPFWEAVEPSYPVESELIKEK